MIEAIKVMAGARFFADNEDHMDIFVKLIMPECEDTPVNLTALIRELDTTLYLRDYLDERRDFYVVANAAESDGEQDGGQDGEQDGDAQPEELRCSLEFGMALCLYVDSAKGNDIWEVLNHLDSLPVDKWPVPEVDA